MEDAATPLLSYTAWRAEAAHISELAQRISKDEGLTALLRAVTSRIKAPDTAASHPATSSSFFSHLFSSSSADVTTQPAIPWCASLAQLLALAELPTPNSIPLPSVAGPSASDATSGASSSAFPAHRHFAQVIAAVANSSGNGGSSNAHSDRGDASAEGHSLVSSSHAVLPMRGLPSASSSAAVVSPASKGVSTLYSPSLESRQRNRFHLEINGVATATATWPSLHEDRDDEDDDGGFDRRFARLKQQAAERNRTQSPGRRAGPAAHPSPPPPNAGVKSEAFASVPLLSYTGLTAARAALDAATLLRLRIRQQDQFRTAPSGRVAEAQTLVLRATASREAQLYTERILEAVHTRLQQHYQAAAHCMVGGEVHQERASMEGAHNASDPHPWAGSVLSTSPEQLRHTSRHGPSSALSSTQLRTSSLSNGLPLHNSSLDLHSSDSLHLAGGTSLLHTGGSCTASPFSQPITEQGNGGTATAARTTGRSPTSASSMSFYLAHHAPSPATHASSVPPTSNSRNHHEQQQQQQWRLHLLPADVVTALHQWKQLVAAQQRALRCEEANDYIAAAHLFLGAAAERVQFGCGRVETDVAVNTTVSEKGNLFGVLTCTPAADLASHGVTHLLRSCGLLLADPLLELEVVYPAACLKAMEEMLATAKTNGTAADAAATRPPPLLPAPHAARVWMLLAQLADFLYRHRLPLPWDVVESPSVPASMPPVAHRTASTSTLQLLWEVSTAVLLFRPTDALHIMHEAVSYTLHHSNATSNRDAAKPPVCVSLHELFQVHMHRSAATDMPSPQRLLAQPGAVPLCLFSLRRASAAAVCARHYAEALRDVEIALHLLPTSTSAAEADVVGAVDPAVKHRGTAEHCKTGYWHVAAAAPRDASTCQTPDKGKRANVTATSTSACLAALTNLDARVHFLLMRFLLVLLASPLTAGDAAAAMLSAGELISNSHASSPQDTPAKAQDAVGTTTHRPSSPVDSSVRINASKKDDGALREQQSSFSLKVTSDVPLSLPVSTPVTQQEDAKQTQQGSPCAAPRADTAANVCTPAAEIAATLRRTFRALRVMADQLRVVEQEDLILFERAATVTGAKAAAKVAARTAGNAGAAASITPYLPKAAYRLSTVLSRAAAAQQASSAKAAGRVSFQSSVPCDQDGGGAAAKLSGPGPEAPSTAPRARQRCVVTSSTRYQQLKQKYQAEQQQPSQRKKEASKGEDGRLPYRIACEAATGRLPAGVEVDVDLSLQRPSQTQEGGTTSTCPVDAAVKEQGDIELHDEGAREEGEADDDASPFPVDPSSVTMHELQHLLRELLTIVCFLTLPLRVASTCTVTPNAALPVWQASAPQDETTNEESDDERAYTHARMALLTLEGRLQRCLRQLGARDRTLVTLLHRLQVELLFPAVCGPPL